jgi:L-asparagine transporter-like permease
MTCVYGILFLFLGNLAGNAIQFAVYVLRIHNSQFDGNSPENQGPVLGVAIAAVSACALLNIFSRKGAIWINNILGVAKVIMLIVIIILGANKARETGTCKSNFNVQSGRARFGDIATSLVYAIYPFGGYEQPFYVLAELKRPRKKLPTSAIATMVAIFILYPLVHFSYFCVVNLDDFAALEKSPDILTVFIRTISNEDERKVEATSAIIAIFIFGNIFVQTYTAARVKQEIAKEGILPFSLELSTQNISPLAWIQRQFRRTKGHAANGNHEGHEDEIPVTATLLHWSSYAISFAAVSWLAPNVAYKYLTFIHSYVFVFLMGSLTGGGLLYLKLESLVNPNCGRRWARKDPWTTWLGPLPALVYFGISTFLVFACFAPKHNFATVLTGKNWIATVVGLSSIFWGLIWWSGLRVVEWMGRWNIEVTRRPHLVLNEDKDYVRESEQVLLRRVIANT